MTPFARSSTRCEPKLPLPTTRQHPKGWPPWHLRSLLSSLSARLPTEQLARMGLRESQACFHCRDTDQQCLQLCLQVWVGLWDMPTYLRNQFFTLLFQPALDEFLGRGDCKHWPSHNVCLGSGGKEQTYPLVFPALCMKSSRR